MVVFRRSRFPASSETKISNHNLTMIIANTMKHVSFRMQAAFLIMANVFCWCGIGFAEEESILGRVAEGKVIYVKHCAGCHGTEGGGDGYKLLGGDPANLSSSSTQIKSDATLLEAIHQGKPNMPSWKVQLSEQDSRDVLTYIRMLTK